MVLSLFGRELADGWQDAESVAGQHDDVARLLINRARDLRIRDELDRVRATRVLRYGNVVVVGHTTDGVVNDILKNRAEPDGGVDLGLLLGGEIDALGIAATLNVEHTGVRPDVLVVPDEQTLWVSRESSLARAGETEEKGDIVFLYADICGGVE